MAGENAKTTFANIEQMKGGAMLLSGVRSS